MARLSARAATRKEARANQRWRLLEAMAHSAGTRGYADTSIAHVIAAAGVSRKAFYEYFKDKEDCFLAAYEELAERLAQHMIDAGKGARTKGPDRTRAQLKLYLEVLQRDRELARACIVEVLAAGPRVLALREEVNRRFAELVFGHASSNPVIRKAIIGGVNDVAAGALMSGRRNLVALLPQLVRFVSGKR